MSTPKKSSSTKQTTTRPTKKQHELLEFLREFIADHGYSPSYREIMRGCNYTSVATVALHVNNLIHRGHVVKRDKSARSLEVVSPSTATQAKKKQANAEHNHALVHAIEERLSALEKQLEEAALNEVYVLIGALKITGHIDAARSYATRLNQLTSG